MAETIDDSETFTIALTENGEPEPTKTPWMLLAAAAAGLYLLLRRE
jgi:MYXO-CTERM domain-containing protein